MVENSASSTQIGKRRTTKTESLMPEQALEILATALRECQQSGLKIGISTLHRAGNPNAIIVLELVDFVDGNFVLANAGSDGNDG